MQKELKRIVSLSLYNCTSLCGEARHPVRWLRTVFSHCCQACRQQQSYSAINQLRRKIKLLYRLTCRTDIVHNFDYNVNIRILYFSKSKFFENTLPYSLNFPHSCLLHKTLNRAWKLFYSFREERVLTKLYNKFLMSP